MKKTFFKGNNYYALVKAEDALINRDPSLPGIGLWYGFWGAGKTENLSYHYGESNIYYIRAVRLWKPRDLLGGICREFGIEPEYRTVARFDQVVRELKRRGQPLYIDEFDYLLKNSANLDVVRDLHDLSSIPIIAIGMEQALGKLEKYGQFWSRILPGGIVEFNPLTPPEMILITREWTDLEMDPESAQALCRFTEGDFRLIVGYLLELEKACQVNKIHEISKHMVDTLVKKLMKRKGTLGRARDHQIKQIYTVGRKSVTATS